MTLLDLFIQVGGISEYADGNSTVLLRIEDGEERKYSVRLDDLVVILRHVMSSRNDYFGCAITPTQEALTTFAPRCA